MSCFGRLCGGGAPPEMTQQPPVNPPRTNPEMTPIATALTLGGAFPKNIIYQGSSNPNPETSNPPVSEKIQAEKKLDAEVVPERTPAITNASRKALPIASQKKLKTKPRAYIRSNSDNATHLKYHPKKVSYDTSSSYSSYSRSWSGGENGMGHYNMFP